MTFQQAERVAIVKIIAGWVIFIVALLSTIISLVNFAYQHSESNEQNKGVSAVVFDVMHIMADVARTSTSFFNIFWHNSPVPQFGTELTTGNIMFIAIGWCIFLGMALQASGARIRRQVKHVREGLEDQLIIEQTKGSEGRSREQLEEKISLPSHTISKHYFTLYIWPALILVGVYMAINFLGY